MNSEKKKGAVSIRNIESVFEYIVKGKVGLIDSRVRAGTTVGDDHPADEGMTK